MLKNLDPVGIGGLGLVVAGIALIAWQNLLIAAGLAFMLAGLGLLVKSIITGMMQTWGMA